MSIRLGQNDYGKSRVRLLRVTHREDKHEIKELTLGIRLEGDFRTAYTEGDNSKILPTDTMKNTVYALAKKHPMGATEAFCGILIEHFLGRNPQVERVHLHAVEHLWARIRARASPTHTRSSAPARKSVRRSSPARAPPPRFAPA